MPAKLAEVKQHLDYDRCLNVATHYAGRNFMFGVKALELDFELVAYILLLVVKCRLSGKNEMFRRAHRGLFALYFKWNPTPATLSDPWGRIGKAASDKMINTQLICRWAVGGRVLCSCQ